MNDYRDFEPEVPPAAGRRARTLPGGISLPMAAMVLLGVMLLTVLWLFFGPPESAAPPGLATATVLPAATAPPLTATLPAGGLITASLATTVTPAAGVVPAAPTISAGGSGSTGSTTAFADGSFARVARTDNMGIRLRFGPGLDTASIRILDEGVVVKITRGSPETAGGDSWWRVQDELGNVGWVSSQFLEPVAAPLGWNPPAASPTFPLEVATP